MKFYTSVVRQGANLLIRGFDNGEYVSFKERYAPYLFIRSDKKSEYQNLQGGYASRVDFGDMYEAKEFVDKYSDVSGMDIYGLTDYTYLYIYDNYSGEIQYDPTKIRVGTIDIECSIEDGFPDISTAQNEVTAISFNINGMTHVFGCKEFNNTRDDVTYWQASSEKTLLHMFLDTYQANLPDVITGWNVEFFDIPYLVNRITNVISADHAKRLSPWKMLKEYEVNSRGRINKAYSPLGVAVLDYLNLYKKFTYSQQESYRLDHICNVELGERKLDYSEYSSLQELYNSNYQKYIEYNIHDVDLVLRLEDKMRLLELVYAISYDAKINFEDALGSVKQWDVIIHNYLMNQNIVIPHFPKNRIQADIMGGHVKEPRVGLSKWVVSFDLTSLYPHLIMQYNISPDTFVTKLDDGLSVDDFLAGKVDEYREGLIARNCNMTANMCVYTKDKRGFLPSLMEKMFDDRARYKKQMIAAKKEYESTKDEALLKRIAMLNNFQMAKKIQLNSAYGSLANMWFRWFDFNNAEAITSSGQLSIRWIERSMNEYLNKVLKTKKVDYVIASDTDSIYIVLDSLVQMVMPQETDEKKIVRFLDEVCAQKIEPYIETSYQKLADYMNAYAQKMKMKREAIASKGIWKAKKMYILNVWNLEGVMYDSPQLKMMGIEAVRSSTPQACRESIKKALSIIMNEDEPSLHAYIDKFRQEFSTLPYEDISSPRGVKDIEKWSRGNGNFEKGTPIHVKGAIAFNDILKKKNLEHKYQTISSGEKIRFSYMKLPNPYNITVISCPDGMPPEFHLDRWVDRDKQFEKTFLNPIKEVVSKIGWHTEQVATLDSFFE